MRGIVSSAHVQVDALNDINFLQTGTITTEKNKFLISSDISTSEFFIPERYPKETSTVTISVEDEHSKSSKILQIFTLRSYTR